MANRRGPRVPRIAPGTVATGMVVAEAKRGVLVEVKGVELLLPRSRFGAAADRIAEASYGTPLTVEVVAESGPDGGVGLSRTAIERSVRQPRPIAGHLRRSGSGVELVPTDGGEPLAVVLLDQPPGEALPGGARPFAVGAPYRGLRFVVLEAPGALA